MPAPTEHDPFLVDQPAGRAGETEHLVDTAKEYLRGLRGRWKLVAALAAAGLVAGAVHFAITPPVYEAETTIQIERRSANSLLASQLPWLDHYFNLEFYPTQYRLLQSRGLAEEVVHDLRLTDDSKYRPSASTPEGSSGSDADRAVLGKVAERLLARLSVEPIRETQLVRIVYRSDDPREAARIANGFAEAFIEFGIRTRSETMTEASDVLTQEIEKARDEVRQREERLAGFRGEDGALPISGDADLTLQRLETLNQDLMAAKRDRIDRAARYQELASLPADAVADLDADAAFAEQRRELQRLEREYQTKLGTLKEGHPDMQALAERIEQSRAGLRQATAEAARRVRQLANAQYQSAAREEQAIDAELQRLKDELISGTSRAAEAANLRVELGVHRQLLNDLVQRHSQTAFATRLQTDKSSNVRVVDRALVPGSPRYPSLRSDLAGGLGAGLFLGLGLGLLLQFLDRTIKGADEIERLLGVPVLAVIPDVSDDSRGYGYAYSYGESGERRSGKRWGDKKKDAEPVQIELLPHVRPRLAVAEAYRALRTALLLSTADELKLIAVTSVLSSEGKTATASNLAVVLAQLGRKVLLIDGDLRKPRLHKVFEVTNRTGVVSYLTSGSEEGAYHKTPIPGLYLMPSGPIPPNPSELLASDRMRELLLRLRQSFDFVIVDTPPTLAVTDPTLVGAVADGVLLCVRSGRVDRNDAQRAVDRLRLAEVRLLGAVLNAHRSGGGSYRYYESYGAEGADLQAGSAA